MGNDTMHGDGHRATELLPGSLVRTRRVWPGGIARAEISAVQGEGNEARAVVCGKLWEPTALEMIRGPVGNASPLGKLSF